MKTVRSIVFLLLAALFLTASPLQAAPAPKKAELTADVRAEAKWVRDFKGRKGEWALQVQVRVNRNSKLIGTICNIDLSYGKTPKKIHTHQQPKVRKSGRIKTRFGPYGKIRLAYGEWLVALTFENPRKRTVLAKVVLRPVRGTRKEINAEEIEERQWFLTRLKQQMELLDVLIEGDKTTGVQGWKELQKEQVTPDPKRDWEPDPEQDWEPDSEWGKKILAWCNDRMGKLIRFTTEYDARYGQNAAWGESHGRARILYLTATLLQRSLIAEYARSLWWEDVRREKAEEKKRDRESVKDPEPGEKEDEKEDAEPEEPPARTVESQMAKRRTESARGNDSYNFRRRISLFHQRLAQTHRQMAILLGMEADKSLGALWSEVNLLQEMEKELAAAFDKAKEGPGKGKFPAERLRRKNWPGDDWSKRLQRLVKTFEKYKDRQNRPKELPVHKTLGTVTTALDNLRTLYLTDLYKKYDVPDEDRANLSRLPASATAETVNAEIQKTFEALMKFFEKHRAVRRQPIEKVRDTLEKLAEELKKNFDDPKADELFSKEKRGAWLGPWNVRRRPVLRKIRQMKARADIKRFFPKAGIILRQIMEQVDQLKNLALMYYMPGNEGGKQKAKTALNGKYKAYRASLEQLNKELKRQKIEPLVVTGE